MSTAAMRAVSTVRAAGDTDPGLLREVNEDRFHLDVARGVYMVIDGVGGQAAGGKAADTAVAMLRARLERETGPVASRLREAIAVANNEIHRLAALRPEWRGMACVLTAVVVRNGTAIVGHVGDTRLYKLRRGRIEKITRDHSPVGEREDAREISELEAMQHPRRNEVYRDVGSEPHEPADPDFIDIQEVDFEPDAALLLCSDGLTDLVDSTAIAQIVWQRAGRPDEVVRALIAAANAAGGKDNVTVVYVEGDEFPPAPIEPRGEDAEITRRLRSSSGDVDEPTDGTTRRRSAVRAANVLLIAVLIVLTFVSSDRIAPVSTPPIVPPEAVADGRIVVLPTESISAALLRAPAGATIAVEPGEYRETLVLKSHVRLVSTTPRGAIVRLPGAASERDAAVVAMNVVNASLDGFRIVGDAATPLGTGILTSDADLALTNVEISGAGAAAIDIGKGSRVHVAAADLRDNPGSAIVVRAGGVGSITHSVLARNGTTAGAQRTVVVDPEGRASFASNTVLGSVPQVLTGDAETRTAFGRGTWFVDVRPASGTRSGARGR